VPSDAVHTQEIRIRLLAIALMCLASAAANAAPARFSNPQQLDQWVTYYYKRPEPAALVDAMLALSKQGAFKDANTASPFWGFLAGALSKQRAMVPATVKRLAVLPVEEQPVVILGLWYSGHPDTKSLLAGLANEMPLQRSMIEDLSRSTPPKLVELPLERDPGVMAALWGNFMATGDEAPVLRVIEALPFTMIAQGDPQRLAMGRVAEWSLASNAAQHPRVMEILRRQASARTGIMANLLNRTIAKAEAAARQEKPPR
jgi:hypothetical protein